MRRANFVAGILVVFCLMLTSLAFSQTSNTNTDTSSLVANRAFLIDFGMYAKRIADQMKKNEDIKKQKQGQSALTGLPTENLKVTASDWTLAKWEIELNSSASSVRNNVLSYVTNVSSGYWSNNFKTIYKDTNIEGYSATADSTVLGARIHFPVHRQNCWAKIHPPFEFNAYDDNADVANQYNGVLDNVGQIKAISVWVKGRNYKHKLAIRLKDRENVEKEFMMGVLYFDNWRELTWINPNYIDQIKDRVLSRVPLYPRSRPFIKFACFVVYRQMDMLGGDFVIYIRDVKVQYDKAVQDEDKDINDEKIWGILAKRRQAAKNREMLKLAEKKILLQQEKAKLKKARTTN